MLLKKLMETDFQYFLLCVSGLALLFSAIFVLLIVKKNPFHLSVPFLILHLIFYYYPFFQYILGPERYYSIFVDYNVWPSNHDVALLLCFSAVNFLFMSFLFFIFSSKQAGWRPQQYRISSVKTKLILILSIIFLLLYQAYASFDSQSLLYLFSPARKELELSGAQRALLSIFPVLLAVIMFNERKRIEHFIPIFIVILLIIFVLGQRRQMIMILLFCIAFNFREYIYISRRRATYIFTLAAALAVAIVPLAWYLRTYSTRLLNERWQGANLLEVRSPLELIFGSSTKGFESLFLQSEYLANGAISTLHSSKFAILSIVPRFIFDEKPTSIPAAIALHRGTVGSTSTFFMSEVITDYYLAVPFFSIMFCFMYSQLDKLRTRGLTGFVFYLLLWSNSVQLFKNGWASSIPFYVLSFLLIMIFFYRSRSDTKT